VIEWQIIILPIADKQLSAIKDIRIRESISKRIEDLRHNPDKQGKPMIGELAEYRSLRAVGQRYRILYKVEVSRVVVSIIALSIRKDGDKADVYELARRLVRLGLLGQE
jgi:mRNA interferase RelE/StbE